MIENNFACLWGDQWVTFSHGEGLMITLSTFTAPKSSASAKLTLFSIISSAHSDSQGDSKEDIPEQRTWMCTEQRYCPSGERGENLILTSSTITSSKCSSRSWLTRSSTANSAFSIEPGSTSKNLPAH
jgi:hypothetical protein